MENVGDKIVKQGPLEIRLTKFPKNYAPTE